MDRIALEWDALGKVGRDLRRARARERANNPYCDLSQRGAYRIRDTKATPPDVSHVAPSFTRVGTFGYQARG